MRFRNLTICLVIVVFSCSVGDYFVRNGEPFAGGGEGGLGSKRGTVKLETRLKIRTVDKKLYSTAVEESDVTEAAWGVCEYPEHLYNKESGLVWF